MTRSTHRKHQAADSRASRASTYGSIMAFLMDEFARKEARLCVRVKLLYDPGQDFQDESVRIWTRDEDPALFENFSDTEALAEALLEIAEDEAAMKSVGKHQFVVLAERHVGSRAKHPFVVDTLVGNGG